MTYPTDNLIRALTIPTATELRAADDLEGGRSLAGHFAVFNEWTEIESIWEGRFLERLAPGAFDRTIAERGDQIKVLYDHGRDPSLGNKPLGTIRSLEADKTGMAYEVDLIDTDYNRDFVIPAAEANLLGASFRMRVLAEEIREPTDPSEHNPLMLDERTITDVELYEFGPVTFPAYASATAGLRSRSDEFVESLTTDPVFVARFTERVGLDVMERILSALRPADGDRSQDSNTTATPDGQPVSTLPAILRARHYLTAQKGTDQ